MANNSINWLSNNVFDGDSSRRTPNNSSLRQYFENEEEEPIPPFKSNNERGQSNPSPSPQQQRPQEHPQERTDDTQQQRLSEQQIPMMPDGMDDMDMPQDRQGPPPVFDREYVPGYLTSLIGRYVRAEFIFDNAFLDKAGRLTEVGVNYFVLEELNGNLIMCDLYSVKFVTVLM